jgi:hypothetical protein
MISSGFLTLRVAILSIFRLCWRDDMLERRMNSNVYRQNPPEVRPSLANSILIAGRAIF